MRHPTVLYARVSGVPQRIKPLAYWALMPSFFASDFQYQGSKERLESFLALLTDAQTASVWVVCIDFNRNFRSVLRELLSGAEVVPYCSTSSPTSTSLAKKCAAGSGRLSVAASIAPNFLHPWTISQCLPRSFPSLRLAYHVHRGHQRKCGNALVGARD